VIKLSNKFDSYNNFNNINHEFVQYLLDLDLDSFISFQKLSFDLTYQHFNKSISFHYPGSSFPSISITGSKCELNCKHCNKHYLKSMIHADSPDSLLSICMKLHQKGAVGCLISGGFDKSAKVPLDKFIDTLKTVKNSTNLILNLHTGLISKTLATQLGDIGIDIVSFDITGDDYIIKEIYGLNKSKFDYKNSLIGILESKIKFVAPHICIGLNPNNIFSEFESLSLIKDLNPELIVLIAFIPTHGTSMESIPPPTPLYISKIISLTRFMFPKSEIALGCMRPKKHNLKFETEKLAFHSGINRIVLPSRSISNYIHSNGFIINRYHSCCALPNAFLNNSIKFD